MTQRQLDLTIEVSQRRQNTFSSDQAVAPSALSVGKRSEALLRLLQHLRAAGYQFVTVTPATHARVLSRRKGEEATNLRDVFGWSLPFGPKAVPPELLASLQDAEAIDRMDGGLLKSRLRVSSLGDVLLLHSAFPTTDEQSVFFGPDTYRFVNFIEVEMQSIKQVSRIVDLGAGTGAGGIVAGRLAKNARLTFTDINPEALELAATNAAHVGIGAEIVHGANLEAVDGTIDLLIANPPYMVDRSDRTYRDGGDLHGAEVSLEWALAGARRLSPKGTMLLYSGVAIIDGQDMLRSILEQKLPALGCSLTYRELDPDVFGEELLKPAYQRVERIAAVGAVITKH